MAIHISNSNVDVTIEGNFILNSLFVLQYTISFAIAHPADV